MPFSKFAFSAAAQHHLLDGSIATLLSTAAAAVLIFAYGKLYYLKSIGLSCFLRLPN